MLILLSSSLPSSYHLSYHVTIIIIVTYLTLFTFLHCYILLYLVTCVAYKSQKTQKQENHPNSCFCWVALPRIYHKKQQKKRGDVKLDYSMPQNSPVLHLQWLCIFTLSPCYLDTLSIVSLYPCHLVTSS